MKHPKHIRPDETEIRGSWTNADGHVVADGASRRIEQLIAEHLVEIARDTTGWNVLFEDPTDGRYWELSYPLGEHHGGGPPLLTVVDPESATSRYRVSVERSERKRSTPPGTSARDAE